MAQWEIGTKTINLRDRRRRSGEDDWRLRERLGGACVTINSFRLHEKGK